MTNNKIKYLSCFSGIGGFEYGIQNSKYGSEFINIGYSEIDKYAKSVYQKHYPNHIDYGDITKIRTEELPDFNFLVGGFPCQAFSIAGKGKGFNDTRGTLFFELARILQDKKPEYFLFENVRGLLSHDNGRTFKTILRVLSDLGYYVTWAVHNSKNYGVPQNRERVFIKGYLREKCGIELLFKTGTCGPNNKEKQKQNENKKENINNNDIDVYGYTRPSKTQSTVVYDEDGLMGTLCGNNKSQPKIKIKDNHQMNVMGNVRLSGHSEGNVYNPEGLSCTIVRSTVPYVGFNNKEDDVIINNSITDNEKNIINNDVNINETLTNDFSVRRLTPVECERLQAFPDGWTEYGKDGEVISKTQRYKMCGNAVTTSVISYIIDEMFENILE